MDVQVKQNIDWVGYVDWAIRDFHGYHTHRGSTYNSYLIRDEKNALIDAVKGTYADALIAHISAFLDPSKIDYIVVNHAEPDHTGALPALLELCPSAEVVCNAKCQEILGQHYDTSKWLFRVVLDGDSLSLGRRTLQFLNTPMVHWPESMFTFVPEDRLLFSMDAFGQHLATSNRFDDEEDLRIILDEARTYYANIVMLYGKQVQKTLDKGAGLDIDIIAPSHGVIWRTNKHKILSAYSDWANSRPASKVLIIYDSMWGSTAKMAHAIAQGASIPGVQTKLIPIRASDNTRIATEVLDAAAVAFGSPTLNMTLMPQMASALTYLKGLRPGNKCGLAFGSYGWAKNGPIEVQKYMEEMKFDLLCEPILAQYVPGLDVLENCQNAGKMLAERALEATGKTVTQ
ncbi:FprA family A-type flavoprotein [bacterium]|nr:FprA family A-type flavoprotein [bacterium]